MPILALDLSLTSPGWFIHDGRGIRSGAWATPKTLVGSSRMARIDWILTQVEREVQDLAPYVNVFIEGYSYASPHQAHQLGELGGAVRLWLYAQNIDAVEIAPPSLKKFLTGKANAKKEDMKAWIVKRYGFIPATNDEADAYALGRLAMCFLGLDQPTTNEQREVLAALRGEKPSKKRRAG